MLYADDIIYECSNCKHPVSTISVLSGNTFGSTLYSDGYLYAPMMDSAPSISKCPNCYTFIWINKLESIESVKEGEHASRLKPLNLLDCMEAIEGEEYGSLEDEKFLRVKAWWLFNDYLRELEHQESELDKRDDVIKDFYKSNLLRLKQILNLDNVNEKIQLAEVCRNLCEFESCMKIINELPANLNWLVQKITAACEVKNSFVIKLR